MLIFVLVSEQNGSFKGKFNRFETRNPVLPGGIENQQTEGFPCMETITDFLPQTREVSQGCKAEKPASNCLLSAHSLTTVWVQ